jgi:GNAT superfamily N-acetyltransferase
MAQARGERAVTSAAAAIRPASPDELAEMIAIDDDASELFATIGMTEDLADDHPFIVEEHARWLAAARRGLAFFAGSPALGLLVVDVVDGARYVEQLSVRRHAMRQGVGRALIAHAIAWANGEPLWLTTYAHVPWNRAFYERFGFAVVPERDCPRAIVATLAAERRRCPLQLSASPCAADPANARGRRREKRCRRDPPLDSEACPE